jgi:GNAT superfamily N-acetyltransferase
LHEIKEDERSGALPGPPSISVRDAIFDQDEAAVREVLDPLAADYPDFSGWLTRKLATRGTRVRVGLLQDRIGAVALSAPKDGSGRVVKLSAFYVADFAQDRGLGANLLWSEVRTWAKYGIEKVYVTVSSRHPELVEFLNKFGFLIEGVSPRRYQDDTAELVLAKHFRCREMRAPMGSARARTHLPSGAIPASRPQGAAGSHPAGLGGRDAGIRASTAEPAG